MRNKVTITVDRDVHQALKERGFNPAALSNKHLKEVLERQIWLEGQAETSTNTPKKEAIAP